MYKRCCVCVVLTLCAGGAVGVGSPMWTRGYDDNVPRRRCAAHHATRNRSAVAMRGSQSSRLPSPSLTPSLGLAYPECPLPPRVLFEAPGERRRAKIGPERLVHHDLGVGALE